MKITRENETESSFQLLRSYVTKLNIDNSFIEYDYKKAGDRLIDVSYVLTNLDDIAELERKAGAVDLEVKINCTVESRSVNIHLIIRGIFLTDLSMSAETFENMMKINGCTALYSVARGIISSTSAQLFSAGNIVLPMVNFIKFHERNQE